MGTREDQRRAFSKAFRELDTRIQLFTSLRMENLDRLAIRRELDRIGQTAGEPVAPND